MKPPSTTKLNKKPSEVVYEFESRDLSDLIKRVKEDARRM